ncbi:pilus assembly protein PilZ [Corallococcus sp. H22C18031201]|uniref:PilZ domain-containing protein n=1 Tax=Citreicoccus inhibens TaxID=2849499 RepID=UPI000E7553FF|nr:PilZ domain-containing protein [Citreicoccus inhibens]MBU8899313.1 PilZ domain-containing protein [Citreicoccus inhibens]RJS25789.1 pilus assembly protein PilZ [Corallococcus sp. H22C18031201]
MAEQNETQGSKAEDRRDSPRVPIRLKVRRADSAEAFVERDGDLSLGGVGWTGEGGATEGVVEIRFSLPSAPNELEVRGEVLDARQGPHGPVSRVRFVDLPMDVELAIARHLDDVRLASGSR